MHIRVDSKLAKPYGLDVTVGSQIFILTVYYFRNYESKT